MAAKKSKKHKPAAKLKIAKPKHEPEVAPNEGDDKMDFGGLPDRDLKKNLGGCG